jgi:hypothetical protein
LAEKLPVKKLPEEFILPEKKLLPKSNTVSYRQKLLVVGTTEHEGTKDCETVSALAIVNEPAVHSLGIAPDKIVVGYPSAE